MSEKVSIRNGIGYIGNKRVSGEIREGKWLVVTESIQQSDGTWQHKCGSPLKAATVGRPLWENSKPKCRFCGQVFSLPLPDDLFLCPNCGNLRSGEVIGTKVVEIVYCPQCETQPETTMPKFISNVLEVKL